MILHYINNKISTIGSAKTKLLIIDDIPNKNKVLNMIIKNIHEDTDIVIIDHDYIFNKMKLTLEQYLTYKILGKKYESIGILSIGSENKQMETVTIFSHEMSINPFLFEKDPHVLKFKSILTLLSKVAPIIDIFCLNISENSIIKRIILDTNLNINIGMINDPTQNDIYLTWSSVNGYLHKSKEMSLSKYISNIDKIELIMRLYNISFKKIVNALPIPLIKLVYFFGKEFLV